MASPGPDPFTNTTNVTYFLAGIVVTILVVAKVFQPSEVRELPTRRSSPNFLLAQCNPNCGVE